MLRILHKEIQLYNSFQSLPAQSTYTQASFSMLLTIAVVNNAWLRKWHKIFWLMLHFPGSLISKYGPLPSLTPALSPNSLLSLTVTQSV